MAKRRVCRCGAIVSGKCPSCSKPTPHQKTTAQRGYDNTWRKLSELKRATDPLCEHCLETQGKPSPATEVHHIIAISKAPHLRLEWSNLMSVCNACHAKLEAAS